MSLQLYLAFVAACIALALAGKSKWLIRQRTRTALHVPTGT